MADDVIKQEQALMARIEELEQVLDAVDSRLEAYLNGRGDRRPWSAEYKDAIVRETLDMIRDR